MERKYESMHLSLSALMLSHRPLLFLLHRPPLPSAPSSSCRLLSSVLSPLCYSSPLTTSSSSFSSLHPLFISPLFLSPPFLRSSTSPHLSPHLLSSSILSSPLLSHPPSLLSSCSIFLLEKSKERYLLVPLSCSSLLWLVVLLCLSSSSLILLLLSVSQSASHPTAQSVSQSVSQSAGKPASHSLSSPWSPSSHTQSLMAWHISD